MKFYIKFIPKSPIDINAALVKIIAWRQIGDKPLSEPMLTQFTDTHMVAIGGDELKGLTVHIYC